MGGPYWLADPISADRYAPRVVVCRGKELPLPAGLPVAAIEIRFVLIEQFAGPLNRLLAPQLVLRLGKPFRVLAEGIDE